MPVPIDNTLSRIPAIVVALLVLVSADDGPASETTSRCFGDTSRGRLENGVKLPTSGKNFVSYGTVPTLLGRTYVHSTVRDVIVNTFAELETSAPGKVFVYGETGKANGGPFPPHKTHQNGLSVDLMVMVVDSSGASVHLPAHLLNRYGYDLEFDSMGRGDGMTIDFEALGLLIVTLDSAARKKGIGLSRVLFAPDLQPHLYSTKFGPSIRSHMRIPTKRSWVRHDEHIHVDFAVPCHELEKPK